MDLTYLAWHDFKVTEINQLKQWKNLTMSRLKSIPKVTIITAVFNGVKAIDKTITNVLAQSYGNIEYIVIDGNSNDGTQDVVSRYLEHIEHFVSEPDDGIYNAWNKGLSLATGDIVAFCNADDFYNTDAVEVAVKAIGKQKKSISYGQTQFISDEGCGNLNCNKFNPNDIYNGFGFMTTSTFVTADVYKEIGNYNESYKIAGDTEWLLRAFKAGVNFTSANNLTFMRDDGISARLKMDAMDEYYSAMVTLGFDKEKIRKIRRNKYQRFQLKKLFPLKLFTKLKVQLKNIRLKTVNVLFNVLPFFTLKKLFLKFIGIHLGKKSYIHVPVKLFAYNSRLSIGSNTTINSNCYLDNRGEIIIGNNVSISHDTKIYTGGHDIQSPSFAYINKKVRIADDVCIFSNVIIMPGVNIGKGAVVYPGSVVSKNIPEYQVFGGNPAIFIKERSRELHYKLDYGNWFSL